MLKKNRSAPNTAVIPVLYYPTCAKQSSGSQRPCRSPNVSASPTIGVSSRTATGPSSLSNPADTPTPLLQHCRAPGRTPSSFVSRRSTHSFYAPRQPVLVYSLNPRITCMANANARSSTHGDIRGRSRRRFSIPTQPTGAANSLSNERAVEPESRAMLDWSPNPSLQRCCRGNSYAVRPDA